MRVKFCRALGGSRIAPREDQAERNARACDRLDGEAIATREPLLRERQTPEPISRDDVDTRKEEGEVGSKRGDDSGQMHPEGGQVLVVADAIGKFFSPCIENVNTSASPAKIAAVPLP
jgi:hypothetical protein